MDIEHFDKVGEFNTLFEHPCNTQVQFDIFCFKKVVDLRLGLIEEEFKELTGAISGAKMMEFIEKKFNKLIESIKENSKHEETGDLSETIKEKKIKEQFNELIKSIECAKMKKTIEEKFNKLIMSICEGNIEENIMKPNEESDEESYKSSGNLNMTEDKDKEFRKLIKTTKEYYMTEIIDGVCDLLYVVYGMMHVFGLKYCNNKDYCIKYNGKRSTEALSNENLMMVIEKIGLRYQKIYSICYSFTNSNYIKKDTESLDEFLCEIYDDLEIIAKLSYMVGYSFGFDVNEGFNIVHDSNMSKACKTEDEAKESIEFIKEEGTWKNPTYKLSKDEKFYILLNENGKILKSKYYKKADLANLNV